MDEAKQLLTKVGVIGGIVDDFYLQFQLDIIYGNNRICLGDEVSPIDVIDKPTDFVYLHNRSHPESLDFFMYRRLVTLVSLNPI